jgi:hypothetical protein
LIPSIRSKRSKPKEGLLIPQPITMAIVKIVRFIGATSPFRNLAVQFMSDNQRCELIVRSLQSREVQSADEVAGEHTSGRCQTTQALYSAFKLQSADFVQSFVHQPRNNPTRVFSRASDIRLLTSSASQHRAGVINQRSETTSPVPSN